MESRLTATWAADDNQEHPIFATTEDWNNGGLRIRKGAAGSGNAFQVLIRDTGQISAGITEVASANVPFTPNTWVQIKVTWDFTVASGTQNTRIYFNGTEATYSGTSTGPVSMPPAVTTEEIYIGGWNNMDSLAADGDFDEFCMWMSVI